MLGEVNNCRMGIIICWVKRVGKIWWERLDVAIEGLHGWDSKLEVREMWVK